MTRRFVIITILVNLIVYVALLLTLSQDPSIAESKAHIDLVPLMPILIAKEIFSARYTAEFTLSLICLMISLNVTLSVIVSILKISRKTLLWAYIGLIIYWLWSILYLIIFRWSCHIYIMSKSKPVCMKRTITRTN